jgi:tRNA A37 threonylcarbamoyladenosine dehydratase
VPQRFQRTELLLGTEAITKLNKARVGVIGIGGVGSFVVEALARSGVGNLVLVDKDLINVTNINRQIHALQSTIGLPKVYVMKDRVLDINPKASVESLHKYYSEETYSEILTGNFDYIVDAIDAIKPKIDLIVRCKKLNIPIVSAMGAGNKINPILLQVSDISNTKVCPLAKIVRKKLRKEGIYHGVKVVFSTEQPFNQSREEECCKPRRAIITNLEFDKPTERKKRPVGSISFVPSAMGLIISSEVIKDILNI